MRMIRKGYNFSNEDIKEAIKIGHDADKKVYITLNNMLNDYEIDEAIETLHFYNDIHVDGLIVADPAILQICKDYGFKEF